MSCRDGVFVAIFTLDERQFFESGFLVKCAGGGVWPGKGGFPSAELTTPEDGPVMDGAYGTAVFRVVNIASKDRKNGRVKLGGFVL